MKAILNVTVIKFAVAILNFCALILVSRTAGSGALAFLITIQAAVVVVSAIIDRGSTTLNNDISLQNNVFYMANNSDFAKKGWVITLGVVLIVFYYIMLEEGWLTLIVVILAIPANIYLQRWARVKRRSGAVLQAGLYSELSVSLAKVLLTPICMVADVTVYAFVVYISTFCIAYTVTQRLKVSGLEIFFSCPTYLSVSYNGAYIFSIVTTIRDQLLSMLLPMVGTGNRDLISLQTRANQVASIAISGVISFVPLQLRKLLIEGRKTVFLSTLFIVAFYFTMVVLNNEILLIFQAIFFTQSNGMKVLGLIESAVLCSGILINLLSITALSLGKYYAALAVEITGTILMAWVMFHIAAIY